MAAFFSSFFRTKSFLSFNLVLPRARGRSSNLFFLKNFLFPTSHYLFNHHTFSIAPTNVLTMLINIEKYIFALFIFVLYNMESRLGFPTPTSHTVPTTILSAHEEQRLACPLKFLLPASTAFLFVSFFFNFFLFF